MKAIEKALIYNAAAVLLVCGLAPAAETFSFQGVSDNNANNVLVGENQLSVTVDDYLTNQVEFLFQNAGPEPSIITAVYFSAGEPAIVTEPMTFNYYGGTVLFSQYATPNEMKEDSTFVTTAGFTADSDPGSANGVNPGERLGIVFTGSADEVIEAMNNGQFRIGLHVQAIGSVNDSSEWFVTTTGGSPVVPAPSAIALGAIGMGLVRVLGSRKNLMV